MNDIIIELLKTMELSIKQLRAKIKEVNISIPGYFTFKFNGKTYKAPEENYVIGINETADKKIALRMLLDNKAILLNGKTEAI